MPTNLPYIVSGTITDSNSSNPSGAPIIVRNDKTIETLDATTNASGYTPGDQITVIARFGLEDGEGKLSDSILLQGEKTPIGSYGLGRIGHFNRAMVVLLMWENLKQQDEIDVLAKRLDTIESDLCNMGSQTYC